MTVLLIVLTLVWILTPLRKIVSVSTPPSIYRDLQGIRESGAQIFAQNKNAATSDPRSTEMALLSLVGRLDLLQPLRFTAPDRTRRIA